MARRRSKLFPKISRFWQLQVYLLVLDQCLGKAAQAATVFAASLGCLGAQLLRLSLLLPWHL